MDFDWAESISILERTPAVLQSMLGGLRECWTHANYGPDTFSPFDVVGHLIHADKTNWLPRARVILLDDLSQPFPPFDRYAMYEASKGKSMADLLKEFAEIRAENLSQLRSTNLTPSQLASRGTHPQLGTVTLSQLLSAWTVHDLGHTHQIVKSMAFQYRDAVGPWRALLTILPRSDVS